VSPVFLPQGALCTVVLSRAMPGASFCGSLLLSAGNDTVGAAHIARKIEQNALELFRGVPAVLPPGPPVSLLAQFILPGLHMVPSLDAWTIDAPLARRQLVGFVLADLEQTIERGLANFLRQTLATPVEGTPGANAPTSEWRH